MAGQQRYNWDTIRRAYVSGEMALADLAKEQTGLDTDPSYKSLRNRSSAEGWEAQRRAFRDNLRTQVATTPTAAQVVQQTEQLIDAAEAIARHVQLAKSLQASYATIQNKIKQARLIEQMDFNGLDPLQMSLLLQRLAAIAATGADIERKALGLSDPVSKTEATVSVQLGLQDAIDRAKDLDPTELQRRIREALQ